MPESAPRPAFPTTKLPRLTSWWVIALALSIAVLLLAPAQLPVSLYKLNLIALAAVAGYWIDRSIFPYARPNIDALRLIPGVSVDWLIDGLAELPDERRPALLVAAQQALDAAAAP